MSTEIEARGSWLTIQLEPSAVLSLGGRGMLEFDLELVLDLGRLPPPAWTAWHIQAWDTASPVPGFLTRSSRCDELLAALVEVPRRDLIWFEPTGQRLRSGGEGRRLPPVVMFALMSPEKFARLLELARIAIGTPGGRFAMELERETTGVVPLVSPRSPSDTFFTYGQPPLVLQASLEASVRVEVGIADHVVPGWLLLAVVALSVLGAVFA